LLIRKLASFSHLEKFTDSKQPFDNNECDKDFETMRIIFSRV